ncbi:MAG: 2-polyprenyl-3-methyl-6-methoxy-1,4-benzoquinone monooxygenase [Gammaproteobacteria bacterium]|nr:2-polyprenyl-3-methyl-6-methoxy-1,4-benzoquinone monooxygenase [Gammaproteobacteria bacterium]
MTALDYTALDRMIMDFDRNVLRVLTGRSESSRQSPADGIEDAPLDAETRRHVAGLMRVNHAGEVSAQALYQGQALLARDPGTREKMQRSADEEIDHLHWCEQRLSELGGRTSLLDPVWYAGSLVIGMAAGLTGDDWSLGFIEETERQVVEHLQGHLDQLPHEDKKTRAILRQMQQDESDHGEKAAAAGARPLPEFIRAGMRFCARVMTRTSYYL